MTLQWPRSCDGVAQCHDLAMEEEEVEEGGGEGGSHWDGKASWELMAQRHRHHTAS